MMKEFKNWLNLQEMAVLDFGGKSGNHINDLSIANRGTMKSYPSWMLDQLNQGEGKFRIKADDGSGYLSNDQIKKALEIRLSGKKIAPTSVNKPIQPLDDNESSESQKTKKPNKTSVSLTPGNWILATVVKNGPEYKIKQNEIAGLKNNQNGTWTYATFYKDKVENYGEIEQSKLKEYFNRKTSEDGKLITSDNILKLAKSQHNEPKRDINLSQEQEDIDSFFGKMKENSDPQHMIIEALAGSGKTTMLLHLAKKYGMGKENWLYLVFNSRNQKEAKEKFPKFVEVLTTHSFAGKTLKANGVKLKSTERIYEYSNKANKIAEIQDGESYKKFINSLGIVHYENPVVPRNIKYYLRSIWINFNNEVSSLVGKLKAYAIDPKDSKLKEKIKSVINDYNFDTFLEKSKEIIKDNYSNEKISEIFGIKNFLVKNYENEIIDTANWLLKKSAPHEIDQEFLQTHKKEKNGTWVKLDKPISRNLGELRDFDDDLWFLALHENEIDWDKYKKYKFVLVDEIQDFNNAQKIILKNLMKTGAKIVAVGDPNQAMYRFRGADSKAFSDISKMLVDASSNKESAKKTLTYNFRSLPELIDQHNTNTKVSTLKSGVEKDPNKEGLVTNREYKYKDVIEMIVDEKNKLGHVKKETAFVSRTNAPLVSAAMDLLKNNIPFIIYGKDLSGEILPLIDRVMRWKGYDLNHDSYADELSKEIENFVSEKSEKWEGKVKKQGELKDLIDNKQAIVGAVSSALSENPNMDIKEFKKWLIRRLGGVDENITKEEAKKIKKQMEDSHSVILVTVHKSKGLEFDRVFELTPSLYPHPKSVLEDDIDQEHNAYYVSSTRAKEELHYVNDDEEEEI